MYCKKTKVYVDDVDQCNTCEHFCKGVACPLLHALGSGVVFMDPYEEFFVTNCGFYKEFKRNLTII